MLALDPDTGKIKWGYQYTPNDAWDYDGMATPILVDTTIDGKPTQGGGRFEPQRLLLRRSTATDGQFIYAMPLVEGINWTTGLDPEDRQADDQRGDEAEDRRQARSSPSCPASRAAPTGSRPPTIRISACSSSPSTSGAWG